MPENPNEKLDQPEARQARIVLPRRYHPATDKQRAFARDAYADVFSAPKKNGKPPDVIDGYADLG